MTLYVGIFLVGAAVLVFLLQPVFGNLQASLDRSDDELTDTQARKRVALLALRDVEYDFLSGKLDETDYRQLKSELTAEALAALEADEAARDGRPDDELEAEIAAIRRTLRDGVTCGVCDYANEPESAFCASCGAQLSETVAS